MIEAMGGSMGGTIGSAIISGISSYFGAKSKAKAEKKARLQEYKLSARLLKYKAAIDDHYMLRDRQEMRNAAGEFGKFSSLDEWAPEYTQTYKPLTAPARPPTSSNIGQGRNDYYSQYGGGTNTGVEGGASTAAPPIVPAATTSTGNSLRDRLTAQLSGRGG